MLIGFDIDDTLLDHRGAVHTAALAFYREQIDKLRAFPNEEAFATRWLELGEEHLKRCLRREITFREQRRCRIREFFGATLEDDEAEAIFARYLRHYEASWQLFSDVIPALEALKSSAVLAVVTNCNAAQQREKLEVLGIAGYFRGMITADDSGVPKPGRGIFDLASTRFGVPSKRCIFVGNDLEVDALGAAGAGWLGVWLNRGAPLGRSRQVLEVPTLGALPGILSDARGTRASLR